MNKIVVKIADYRIASGSAILTTYGLGSCLAVVLFDPEIKTGGMGHIMLPSSNNVREPGNPKKFADLCIRDLVRELEDNGCRTDRMVAKIAGGAKMFEVQNKDKLAIGERNRDAVLAELAKRGIPLMAEDTGDNYGRTVEFYTENGHMLIKSLRHSTKVI